MKRLIVSFIFIVLTLSSFSQSNKLAILDLCLRNSEVNKENLASAIHMAEVAGMPYIITSFPGEAANYPFMLITSSLRDGTLQADEISLLYAYVYNGGVILAPFIQNSAYFPLFGISATKYESNRYWINFDLSGVHKELEWVDDKMEQSLPLADLSYTRSIYTRGYTKSNCEVLASFEDNSAAIVVNKYGNGKAYAFGFELKELVLRNILNRDYNAHRIYSNGFEPATDMILLFLRSLYTNNLKTSVYKHTSPGKSSSTLILTHDVDSQTGMDSMFYFSEWEANQGIKAHYFITTRYFSDALMGIYYKEAEFKKLNSLLEYGHQIGSHSVGHFPDFANMTLFPIGLTGNTKETYQPANHDGITSGGMLTAELEVSRDLLVNDIGANVRSFRAGHLAFNLRLINVMGDLGYAFNSTNSANDVLTNFPYRQRTNSAFSGSPSNVYELPMTISDASKTLKLTEETMDTVVSNWVDVLNKNNANHAPTVLLIHPNRGWKLDALKRIINEKPQNVITFEFNAFGDYWLARRDLNFDYSIKDNILSIWFADDTEIAAEQSLIVKNGADLAKIELFNKSGKSLNFDSESWKQKDIVLFNIGKTISPDPIPVPDTLPDLIQKAKRLAILDLTEQNFETDKENLASVKQMADVAGIPFLITSSLKEALVEDFVLLSSEINGQTLSANELTELKLWVSKGGILIAPFVSNFELFELFGIENSILDKNRYKLNWVDNNLFKELKWIDDPREKILQLADPTYYRSIYTRGFSPTTASSMAYFEDNSTAVSLNYFLSGKAYAFGIEWKDVILRNLLDKDYKAQRAYSNDFEPASDVFMLLLRSIFTVNQEIAVYKHTSPGESKSALLITHDVDSRTIIGIMPEFSDWEFSQGISTHYFVTTHYFKDANMSAYFEPANYTKIRQLIDQNHTIGSHSVGHFPDFSKGSVFPIGLPGNTQLNYQPYYDGISTIGGSVYGELEVSRDILNSEIQANVRSFRAGALEFNPRIIEVMEELQYNFNSTMNASNVLTNFPYFQRTDKAFSGKPSTILEIPLTLTDMSSDLKLEENTIEQVLSRWNSVIDKNSQNHAPTTLLISPNRSWKLMVEQNLLANMDKGISTYNFDDFGDFWLDRSDLDFDYSIKKDTVFIQLNSTVSPAADLSFIIENGRNAKNIVVTAGSGQNVPFLRKDWKEDDLWIGFSSINTQNVRQKSSEKISSSPVDDEFKFRLYPNPAKGFVNLNFESEQQEDYTLRIMDLSGRLMAEYIETASIGSNTHRVQLDYFKKGIYLVQYKSLKQTQTIKFNVLD